MEASRELLKQALKLPPKDKLFIIEGLLESLDEPDKEIDEIWAKEAESRLDAYREGRIKGIPYNNVFPRT